MSLICIGLAIMVAGHPRQVSKIQQQAAPDDDRDGLWTRECLERMDADFCHALERAIRSGREHAPTPTTVQG